jgi:hypothetical protein
MPFLRKFMKPRNQSRKNNNSNFLEKENASRDNSKRLIKRNPKK